jgi:hypothetical protein
MAMFKFVRDLFGLLALMFTLYVWTWIAQFVVA